MLKPAATNALIEMLQPIQDEFQASPEWKEIEQKAYPPPEVKKKEKRVKDRGTRFPGTAKDVQAKPDGHVEGKEKGQVDVASNVDAAMKHLVVKTNGTL